MAYTSYFSSNSATKAQPNNSGGNTGAGGKGGYTSYFGTKVQQAPTADELKANRAKRAQIKAAQPVPVAPPSKVSLLTKVTKVAEDVGNSAITGERTAATGIARTLPGGTADIKAQTKATEQANKDVNFLQQQKKAGKITPARANTLIQTRAKEASNAASETGKTVKALPSKGQLAAGFASTAADIATGGTFGGLGKAAKTGKLIKASEISKADKVAKTLLTTRKAKVAQEVGDTTVSLGTNAAAAGLNAAAGGGSKSDVIKNAAAGAVLPEALHAGATTASKVGTRIADGLSSKSTKTLLTNTKTQKLIKTGQEATSKPIAAQVNQAHIEQGLVKGDLKQTPIKDLSLAADHNQKLDSQKVAQYKKQIKDGEPIEPIVTHNVNGQQVIVDGQHKLEAAKQLGYDHVPTVEKVTGAIPGPKAVVPQEPHSLKVFGKTILMTKENGFEATKTKDGGVVYKKTAMRGNNTRGDRQAITHYYSADGKNITQAQHAAMVDGTLKTEARPLDSLQTAIETAHNTGDVATAKKLEAQLPDKGMNPDAPPLTPEARAELTAKMRAEPVAAAKVDTSTTRTLRPSETAHMPEIGGYTHSEHMAQDYADTLRGQEQTAKGGQMIPDGQGGYKRTSEHSRFFRDIYKETGRPPTKADYLEEAKKQLESGKDGLGAGEDYKKLLEREAKPVPRVQIESTVRNVPQGTSKVAQRIAKDIKGQYGDLAEYEKINIKDQATRAEKLLANRDQLDKVISGEKPLPSGLRATSIITAVRSDPVLSKDSELLRKLASSNLASESSFSAQELRLARENARHDPVMAIKNLRDARIKAIEKRTKGTVTKAVNNEIKAIQAAKPHLQVKTWNDFVESIKC